VNGFLRGLAWLLAILGAAGVLLYLFVLDVWVVPGKDAMFTASVLPTLAPEDKILIQRGRTPTYGELARCMSPETPGTYVIGRVFGGAGDQVEVSDPSVKTNGRALAARHGCPPRVVPHPVTEELVTLSCGAAETGAWTFEYLVGRDSSGGDHSATVEPGRLYLVSDNRLMHQDSRDFGQVDASTCEHVVFRLWGERYLDSSRRFNFLW
jgi:signal peptidase I